MIVETRDQEARAFLQLCEQRADNLAAGVLPRSAIEVDNNEDDSQAGLRNAQILVDAKVDLAVLFEPVESIGHAMADRLYHAGIPFITIDVPLQGGVYFGANNYQAGKMAGMVLARFAAEHWRGSFDRVVLVESSSVGPNVQARLTGVLVGIRDREHHPHGGEAGDEDR